MSVTIHDRIALLVSKYGEGKNTVFANKIGTTEGSIRGYIKGIMPKQDTLEKIVRSCEGLSAKWLLTGEGEMYLNGEAPPKTEITPAAAGEGIPLIPVDAMAGFFAGERTVMLHECERFVVPAFRNADFLITVRGDSMIPRYFSGDLVACKVLGLSDLFFQWGKVYILDTEQGALIKKVEQGSSSDTIKLVSENAAYSPFEIPRACVYHIAIVLGLIRGE